MKTNKNMTYKLEAWIQSSVFHLFAVTKKLYLPTVQPRHMVHAKTISSTSIFVTYHSHLQKLNLIQKREKIISSLQPTYFMDLWFGFSVPPTDAKAPSPPLQFPHMQKRKKTKPKMKLQNQGSSSNFLQFQNSVEGVTSICTC